MNGIARSSISNYDVVYKFCPKIGRRKKEGKGDLYEYMISKLQTAGRIGQFRTPRHIIRMMVELMDPQITDMRMAA